MSTLGLWEAVWQDLRHACRTMRQNASFAATAVLTLALGIGANTAMFTLIRSILLKPLAYRDPDGLVLISGGMTSVRYRETRSAQRSFDEFGCYRLFAEPVSLAGGREPEALQEAHVSGNFLHILGVGPALGRGFRPEEDVAGAPATAMISYEVWQRRFGGDPAVVGRKAILGEEAHTIIGVLPPGFAFPFPCLDVWVTGPEFGLRPVSPVLTAFGRLNPGSTLAQATAEAQVLHRQYAAAHPGMLDGRLNLPARAVPLKENLVSRVHSMLWMLFGAVSFVLLIACANVASLLLARAASRTREFALRAALGAGRARLTGQLLTESILLAACGGALGLLLARWSLAGVARATVLDLPRTGEIRLDGAVLAFALALSIATGVLFGMAPSLGASRPDLAGVLRAGEPIRRAGVRLAMVRVSGRGVLVAGQVALSTVLLTGSALLLASVARVSRVQPGFRPDHLLTMQLSLAPARYGTARQNAAFFDRVVERVEALPGVSGAAACRSLPSQPFAMTPVQPTDQAIVLMNKRPLAALQEVTPAYFDTLRIPLRRGREFNPRDDGGAKLVVVINEKLARLFWPAYPGGVDPVGKSLLIGADAHAVEIVGVVADVHQWLEANPSPAIYRPWAQTPLWSAALVVRTPGDPLHFANAVRARVLAIDRDQPVSAVKTMDDVLAGDMGQTRLILDLLGGFAGVALLLTMIGIYGVIAYSVAQRTGELGLRRALGAREGSILRLVLGEGLGMALSGVAIGAGSAFWLTRLMSGLLFLISPTDPAIFAAVAILLVVLALGACYLPARRATQIDPMAALRQG